MKQSGSSDPRAKIATAEGAKASKNYYSGPNNQRNNQQTIHAKELISESHFLQMKQPNTNYGSDTNLRQRSIQPSNKQLSKLSHPNARGAISSAMKLGLKVASNMNSKSIHPTAKIPAGPQSGQQKSQLTANYIPPTELYSQGVPFFVDHYS